VNVSTPQSAGAIIIKGKISGAVIIKAPTGTNFAAAPTATTTSGDINSAKLAQTDTQFTFSIGNASLADVTVRVDGIQYNTQYFGLLGTAGDLACEISGAALSNQVALVVNAFTAKSEIKGSNDNNTDPPTPAPTPTPGSEPSPSTSNPTPAGSINTGGRSLDSSNNTRRERTNNRNDGGGSITPSTTEAGKSGVGGVPPPRSQPPINNAGASPGPVGGGGAIAPSGGSGNNAMGGTGSISQEKVDKETLDKRLEAEPAPARELEITPGLHFCDKDFKPVTALVLDKAVAGEAGGRIWIVLKLKKDKQPDKVETVTVKLTVNGVTRELTLTETSKTSGEFRCGKEGILVIANENPDSNAEEKAAEPPKPRFDR
jgi:hypothetical protein